MARKEPIVYLDTHVIVWLYDNLQELLSSNAKEAIENNNLRFSPFVKLELQYLNEVGKIKTKPDKILNFLDQAVALQPGGEFVQRVVDMAIPLHWTRDVFDRLIVAEADLNNCGLVTKDKQIRRYYKEAIW